MSKKFIPVVFAVSMLVSAAGTRAAETFKIDGSHSFVVFRIQHIGVSHAWGRFDNPSGTVVIDEADPSKSKFEVEVKTASVNTGNEKRDAHLKNADFFNARQFPTISFKSTSVKKSGDNKYDVAGDLTMHGVTKALTVTIEKIGEGDKGGQFGYRAGFDTSFTVKRSDFGMTNLVGPVGDDVNIWVSLEGSR
jgi:polyisoprenoid-binding protein YceI